MMGEILTDRLCPQCSLRYRKNPECSGDYDEDGRLLAYCPKCGVMHPPLVVNEEMFSISIRQRHRLGTIFAKRNNTSYRKVHAITNDLKYITDSSFVSLFIARISDTFDINLRIEEVVDVLQGSGKHR